MKKGSALTAKKPDSGEDFGLDIDSEDLASPLEETASGQARHPFPIIGIGASAGGLEANRLQKRG